MCVGVGTMMTHVSVVCVLLLEACPPPAHKTHWPGKPADVKVEEYVSDLRGGVCYGRENVTWRIPNDSR